MTQLLVVVTGLIYAGCALDQWRKGSPSTAMMFAGYAFANIGVYLQAK